MKYFLFILLVFLLIGCSREMENSPPETAEATASPASVTETGLSEEPSEPEGRELLQPLINPRETDFVRVKDYIPGVLTDLKYAASDNFTGQVVYGFEDVFLRYGTVMKLKAVSEELAAQGMGIKIWDGFRPVSAQFKLWEICPDDTYVANPNKGYSNHSRGFAVDLTLVDAEGSELEMPTGFDDFSAGADRDYSDTTPEAARNARLLEELMEKHGFQGYWGEWWHFNDTSRYDVETCFDPGVISLQETVSESVMLDVFQDASTQIMRIPEGECVTLLGYIEGFAMIEYWGYRGYIPMECLKG